MAEETNNPESQTPEHDYVLHHWYAEEVILKDYTENVKIDLTSHFLRMEITSGINVPFVTGNITIEDFMNIEGYLPLTGNEIIEITVKSVFDKSLKKKFKVIKIEPSLESPTPTQKFYMIKFVSMPEYMNMKRSFSRNYKNLKGTTIVKKIYEEFLTEIDSKSDYGIFIPEESQINNSLFVPYYKPLKAINYVSLYTPSKEGIYDFVFYEDFSKCNYVSLSYLKELSSDTKFFSSKEPEGRSLNESGEKDPEHSRKRIISYSLGGDMYDVEKNIENGNYAGTNINFDMTLKKVTNRIYFYEKEFYKQIPVENAPTISPKAGEELGLENTSKVIVTFEPSLNVDDVAKSQNILDSKFRRDSVNNMFKQVLTIKTNSRFDLYPGEMVEVAIKTNRMADDNNKDSPDPYISGRYMVLMASHFFEKSKSKSTFVLGRDSIPETLPIEISLEEGGST